METKMKKIIIDTDPGVDDALAILYAARSTEVEIKAVTTVFGNLLLAETTRNALILADLTQQKFPVYQGAEFCLNGGLCPITAQSQQGGFDFFTGNPAAGVQGQAVEALLSIIDGDPYEITLVALGPLTNVAQAYAISPQTMSKLKELVIMGGAVNTYGNVTPTAEFNFYCDPEAAALVLASPLPKTLVPVNVCRKVVLTPADLKQFSSDQEGSLLEKLVGNYLAYYLANERLGGAVLYDPVAMGIGLNPRYGTVQQDLNVQVETAGVLTRGMAVADLRPFSPLPPTVRVCWDIDVERFKIDLYATLLGKSKIYKEQRKLEE